MPFVRCLLVSMVVACTAAAEGPGRTIIDYDAFESMTIGGTQDFDQRFDAAAGSMIVDVDTEGEKNWSVVHHSPNSTGPVAEGDIVVYSVTMRVTGKRTDVGDIGVYAESSVNDKSGSAGGRVQPTTTKQTIRRSVVSPGNFDAGEFRLALHLATKPQEVELFHCRVEVFPAGTPADQLGMEGITWRGRDPDAEWRDDATRRIDRLRRSNMWFRIVNAAGDPVTDARVTAKLTKHAWRFGTFVSGKLLEDSDDGRRYEREIRRRYNFVTLPAYLADWGWLDDNNRRQYFELADWAQSNNIDARGHLLVYPGWSATPPSWFDLPKDELRSRMEAHIPVAVDVFADRGVHEWDVTNELRMNKDFMNEIGGVEVAAQWFKTARELDPDAVHYLNETFVISNGGSTESEQATLIDQYRLLVDHGAQIDGIGLQGHFGSEMTPPEKALRILDKMGELTGKVLITEFDIDNEDKESQADYLRDFYTLCFSHPAVEGIVAWGFWEPEMWKPRGHLLATDWSETPASRMYMSLVHDRWKTDESVAAGTDGTAGFRGFRGEYDVTIRSGDYVRRMTTTLGDQTWLQTIVVP